MVAIYVNRIKTTKDTETPFTIDNVPNLWKQKVLDELDKEGLDGYGNPIITE